MNERLTVSDLQKRWERALVASGKAVDAHAAAYADLKSLVLSIIDQPLDIKDYFPTVEKLSDLLHTMDPKGSGSIFHLFSERISPESIWQVRLLRVECHDLLAHLDAFEQWRRQNRRLRLVQ